MTTALARTALEFENPEFENGAVPMDDFASKVSGVDVRVPHATVDAMDRVVAAVQDLVMSPYYRSHVLELAPELARAPMQPDVGLFSGFDFHLAESGPKLIEINTNAGGAFYGALIDDLRHANGAPGTHPLPYWSELFLRQVQNEWALAGRGELKTVAIVDDMPEQQFLRLEFQLAARTLNAAGIRAFVLSPQQLVFRDGALRFGKTAIDLVYNRLTSFALDRVEDAPLREALAAGAAWITPGPRAHALLACKRNLAHMGDAAFLSRAGLGAQAQQTLLDAVPKTVVMSPDNVPQLWANRSDYYFKPLSGYGSRGVYAGAKLTRKTWEEIVQTGRYVAQAEVPPSRVEVPGQGQMRCDIRNFAYQGRSFMRLARLYRGQTTNFRTPGGGFAPVVEY
ncbi:MAG: hypothetical protein ABL973_08600 [Micropepsaceae bacterium]